MANINVLKCFVNAEGSAREGGVCPIVSASDRDPVASRSRAFDLRFSRALAASLVPRPPPGLIPRARSRGRAPTPTASTSKWADLAEMTRFYSLLGKIFVVLLLLRGDVSVLLAAGEIFVVPEMFVVLAADSRFPLGPCLPAKSDCWLLELS